MRGKFLMSGALLYFFLTYLFYTAQVMKFTPDPSFISFHAKILRTEEILS